MTEDRHTSCKHRVIIDERSTATVDGVTEVISFDEESIVCETDMGVLVLKGKNMHVEKLNLEQAQLSVQGEIESLEYSDEGILSKNNGGLLGRIFK
ncbi:MAG TPA: sporulation protein YabP [Lachnospiraceae bacterium]|nr:sporulation protein YabP [Lachnospiraceae bacterium]